MSRFRPAIALAILLVLLALPASAVTSKQTNRNGGGFLTSLWSAITALFGADGHCSLDPDGRCLPG